MENKETNYDDIIGKAIADPEGTMQSLDNAKNSLQQLIDKTKEVQTIGGSQPVQEDENTKNWTEEDTIDALMSRIIGYTYYDTPWDDKIKQPQGSVERYNINDESGQTVKANASEDDIIDYANTVYHYDMADSDSEEFKTFEQAKEALENERNFKIVNVKDTKQMSLFPPKKETQVEEKPVNKVISKMDEVEYQEFINSINNAFVRNTVDKAVSFLRSDNKKEAYTTLRRLLDYLRESKENLVNSKMFTIIAESEKPRLTKADILEFVKKRKNNI